MRALVVVALVGCVESKVVVCGDDRVCPAEYACDEVHGLCVLPAQLVGCAPDDTTSPCTLPGDRAGECDLGVCLEIVCGDGIVAGIEECEPGDGATYDCVVQGEYYDPKVLECSARCVFPETECTGTCGDGELDPAHGEVCEVGVAPPGTCLDFGFEAGRIGCNESACGPDLNPCRDIGFVPFVGTVGQGFAAVAAVGPDHVFISEGGSGVVEVNGPSVERTSLGTSIFALWANGPADVYAVGGGSSIFHFDGTTWTTQRPVTTMGLFGVWGTGNVAYAVGTGGQILKTTGGGTWTSDDTSSNQWNAIFGTSATSIRVVGWNGAIRKFDGAWSNDDASDCWNGDTAPMLRGVWSSGPSDIFVVGNAGYICHFNGTDWSRQPSGTLEPLNAVWGRSPNDVFAVGGAGIVLHYDGKRWRRADSGIPVAVNGVSGLGTDVYIVGAAGTARRHAGATFSFETFTNTPEEPVASISARATREFLVTNSHALERTAAGWSPIFTSGGAFASAWQAPDGALFITSGFGLYRRTPSGTESMEPIATFDDNTLRAIGGRSSTDVIAATDETATFYHLENGTWTQRVVNPALGLYINDISFGPTVAFAVGQDTGGLAYRFTAATGWTSMTVPANTPSLRGVVAITDTLVFAVGDEGTILQSTDGLTFMAMESGTPVFLVDVAGTAPDDVFASAPGTLLHFDGTSWLPVAVPLGSNGTLDAHAGAIYLGGFNTVTVLERDPTW